MEACRCLSSSNRPGPKDALAFNLRPPGTSAQPPPHADLAFRVQQLLSFYTARKLLWGSDFPYVLLGGHARNAFALEYAQAPGVLAALQVENAVCPC